MQVSRRVGNKGDIDSPSRKHERLRRCLVCCWYKKRPYGSLLDALLQVAVTISKYRLHVLFNFSSSSNQLSLACIFQLHERLLAHIILIVFYLFIYLVFHFCCVAASFWSLSHLLSDQIYDMIGESCRNFENTTQNISNQISYSMTALPTREFSTEFGIKQRI